ncbi:hypothetical protein N0V82_004838 [Gnomoniopsis sp. IMI 355080]|nr:hypothetical protein N0V82_004838 [Gnomoniopsis sp. IMI 355080]
MPATTSELQPDEKHQIDSARGAILGVYFLALMVCLGRLYVRKFILNAFQIDDWACVTGLVSTTSFAGLSLAVIEFGAGRHLANIPFDDARIFYIFYYAMTVSFIFFALPIKTSLLLHIRRVVPFREFQLQGGPLKLSMNYSHI